MGVGKVLRKSAVWTGKKVVSCAVPPVGVYFAARGAYKGVKRIAKAGREKGAGAAFAAATVGTAAFAIDSEIGEAVCDCLD